VIEVDGLVKRFSKTVALDGIKLAVPAGSVCALLGPNGAGKTTVVRILATLLRADAGTARVGGFDVASDPDRVRELIGLTGQFAAVDEALTGAENLLLIAKLRELPRREARRRVAELLDRFGLADVGGRLARTYSGGMRRKLDLGASLVGEPRLLLLDEPTTGLDPRSRIELWDAIRGLVGRGTDVLLTTQYLDEADHLAGHIVIIDHGRVVAAGTPSQLKQRLGGNVIEIQVRDRDDLPRVADALAGLDHGQPQIEQATRRVSVSVDAGSDPLRQALRSLDAAGVVIGDVSLRSPKLDEVFLALTGQPLKDQPGTTAEHPAA